MKITVTKWGKRIKQFDSYEKAWLWTSEKYSLVGNMLTRGVKIEIEQELPKGVI